MFKNHIYYKIFIGIIIVLKISYIISTILYDLSLYFKWNSKHIHYLYLVREDLLSTSELFMYILLLVIFRPKHKPTDIKIGREEQIIIFILGILGIIHTNYHHIRDLFRLI